MIGRCGAVVEPDRIGSSDRTVGRRAGADAARASGRRVQGTERVGVVQHDPTPSTPWASRRGVAPSWGGQAMSGADALWGRDTMEGLGAAGPGSGDRLDAELGYALPLGSRLVGTPRFGVTTSEYGRGYRLGYGLAVVQGGAMSFQFGLDAQRRESLGREDADHSLVGRLTVGLVGADGRVVSPARRVSLRASYSGDGRPACGGPAAALSRGRPQAS